MSLENYSNVGEIVASICVMLSLIYVGIQVRQNTRAVRASGVEATVTNANSVRQSIYENSDISRIYMSGLKNVEALSEEDRERFRLIMHNALWGIWNTYAQVAYSQLAPETWESQKPLIGRFMGAPGGRWFWETYNNEFEKRFRQEIDSILAAP